MKKLGEKHFVSRMHEEYQSDVKFCFILGAGASVSSGIPTGLQMMSQWRDYLLQESKNRRTGGKSGHPRGRIRPHFQVRL